MLSMRIRDYGIFFIQSVPEKSDTIEIILLFLNRS